MGAADGHQRAERSAVLGRRAGADLPTIVRAEGLYLYDDRGNRYLDAVGGAGVAILNHADPRVLGRLADRRSGLSYTYTAFFNNPWQERMARRLLDLAGMPDGSVVLASGGSEANEIALKLARYAALGRGEPERTVVISRDRSYHGNTLAALRVSGRPTWQRPIADMLTVDHVEVGPPYCYRCPWGRSYPDTDLECATEIGRAIERAGPERVLAVLLEPVVGTSATAVRPPDDYLRRVRQICDRYGVLLIADEVMTGHWRTGRALALHHAGVAADLVTMGKSLASGYAPLAACVVSKGVRDAVTAYADAPLTHGFTFSGNPVSSALGLIVGEICDEDGLYERPARIGRLLRDRLADWAATEDVVGDVRGTGLLVGVEFVADPATKEPFPAEATFAARIAARARDHGVLVIPGIRDAKGAPADHIQLTPPYVLTEAHVDQIVEALALATRQVKDDIART